MGRQALPVVAMIGDMDEVDVDRGVRLLEPVDERPVGRELGGIAEDHE